MYGNFLKHRCRDLATIVTVLSRLIYRNCDDEARGVSRNNPNKRGNIVCVRIFATRIDFLRRASLSSHPKAINPSPRPGSVLFDHSFKQLYGLFCDISLDCPPNVLGTICLDNLASGIPDLLDHIRPHQDAVVCQGGKNRRQLERCHCNPMAEAGCCHGNGSPLLGLRQQAATLGRQVNSCCLPKAEGTQVPIIRILAQAFGHFGDPNITRMFNDLSKT